MFHKFIYRKYKDFMGKLPFINEKIDYIGFLEKYLYLVLMLDELDSRQADPEMLCEHSFNVAVIKEMVLCSNDEAVKIRRTLMSLGWVRELPERVHQLAGIKGRKKTPVRLTNEAHLTELAAYMQTWQYKVVAGLLQCPPAGGWKMEPKEWADQIGRLQKSAPDDGGGKDKHPKGSHIAKLPVIERLVLAALWAQASPVGKVEAVSLNELARQCSLKPSKRFQLAISHLIAGGAIVYVQGKVVGGNALGKSTKSDTEIQLNPFYPWVAEYTPPVTLVVIEAEVGEYTEQVRYPKALSKLTGIERLCEYGYRHIGGGVRERIECLMTVTHAANPYYSSGMNKQWSKTQSEIKQSRIMTAAAQHMPITVPAGIRGLHDDYIVTQRIIREHLLKKIELSLTKGDLVSKSLLLDSSADFGKGYSPLMGDRYRAKIERLPIIFQEIISNSERIFQDRLLGPLFLGLGKTVSDKEVSSLYSPHMTMFPFDPAPEYAAFVKDHEWVFERMRCVILTDCKGMLSEKRVIHLGVKSEIPEIYPLNSQKDIRKI